MNKRGQVTLFIIIAIVILGAMAYFVYPKIKASIVPAAPASSVEKCMLPVVTEAVEKVSKQGGSINPSLYYMYMDNKLEYLCYTRENYKTCVMQQPMLKYHIEQEIGNYVRDTAVACVEQLKSEMESRGYSAAVNFKNISVELTSSDVEVVVNVTATFTKQGTQSFNEFVVRKPSKIYDLVMMTMVIMNYEATYGDSDTQTFMAYYPNMKIEKIKQGEGSKVYILTNLDAGEVFQFATRSLAWPGGYKATL